MKENNLASQLKSSTTKLANGISKQGVKCSDLAINRGKGSNKKYIGKGSGSRSRGLVSMSQDIRKYFVRNKYDIAADVLSIDNVERESERESDNMLNNTHPTFRNTGSNQVKIEDYEEFQELMDLDMLREVTLDNWTLFKGGGGRGHLY